MPYYSETITLCGGAASVTIRESIQLDQIDAIALYPMLAYNRNSPREKQRVTSFIDAFERSTVTGDLGFEWPADDTDREKLQSAFEGWKGLRQDLVTWYNALDRVNKKAALPNP